MDVQAYLELHGPHMVFYSVTKEFKSHRTNYFSKNLMMMTTDIPEAGLAVPPSTKFKLTPKAPKATIVVCHMRTG